MLFSRFFPGGALLPQCTAAPTLQSEGNAFANTECSVCKYQKPVMLGGVHTARTASVFSPVGVGFSLGSEGLAGGSLSHEVMLQHQPKVIESQTCV